MAALSSVTRTAVVAGAPKRTAPRRPSQPLLCALLALTASVLSTPTSAQTRPADQTVEPALQEPDTAATPSPAALERIRRGLVLQRPTALPRLTGFDIAYDLPPIDGRPAIQFLPGLDVVGGLNLFGLIGSTGRQLGPPTHRDMLNHWTPREMREAGATDVLGIATASAFAIVPYAITKIGGWLFGDDGGDDSPAHPILTEGEETRARAGVTADPRVLEADIRQRGQTVALTLVVRADTTPDTARALGARFVRLVKTLASGEPDPEDDFGVGVGDYDYIVRVSSPTDSVIALGGKATSHTRINW